MVTSMLSHETCLHFFLEIFKRKFRRNVSDTTYIVIAYGNFKMYTLKYVLSGGEGLNRLM